MAAGGAAERARQRGQAAKTRWRGEIKPSQLGNAAGVQYGAQSSPVLRIKQGRSQNQELDFAQATRSPPLREVQAALHLPRYDGHGASQPERHELERSRRAAGTPRPPAREGQAAGEGAPPPSLSRLHGLQELAQRLGRGALASACGAGAASGAHPRRGLVAQSIAEVHRLTQALEDEHQRAETEKAKAEKLVCKHSARGSAANARGTPAHTPRRACPRRRCTTA